MKIRILWAAALAAMLCACSSARHRDLPADADLRFDFARPSVVDGDLVYDWVGVSSRSGRERIRGFSVEVVGDGAAGGRVAAELASPATFARVGRLRVDGALDAPRLVLRVETAEGSVREVWPVDRTR